MARRTALSKAVLAGLAGLALFVFTVGSQAVSAQRKKPILATSFDCLDDDGAPIPAPT